MKKLLSFSIIALFICMGIGVADTYVDPSGGCGNTTYATGTDVFGDIIDTYPSANPGPSNAWVGTTYAGGYVYQAKNIATGTLATIYKIDPATGTIVSQFNCPFTGYVMNIHYDGTGGFWVTQWSPSNTIWHLNMTGGIISSFVPATAPYSARTTMWDGTNLWVGADQGLNNTKLFKMSPTGTVLASGLTGTVVGWYMGGAWNTQAPAGSAIFIVDNGTNTIRRLNVVELAGALTVTLNASIPSPAASPDVAEGLGFDGQYLWHNGAYASAGLVWQLDDGIAGGIPVMTLNLTYTSGSPVLPGGGNVLFNADLENDESVSVPFQFWCTYTQGATVLPAYGPISRIASAGPNYHINRDLTQTVAGSLGSGTWTYTGYIGSYPGAIWTSDSFTFVKSAVGDGGTYYFENTLTGWDEETAVVSATPANYELKGASPNPFNPTTTLSFALPQAGQVRLSVYNAAGRQVAELVNGYRDAGTHEVTFDASNLSSGLYIYQLSSGDFNATGKMVLMK